MLKKKTNLKLKTNISGTTGEVTVTVTKVRDDSTSDEWTILSVGGEMIVTIIEGWGATVNITELEALRIQTLP